MRKHSILLCFIHGFKGDDDTFGGFPEHLKAMLQHTLPTLNITTAVYPKYETRGELPAAVSRFREWLQNRVIDLEVSAATPSPTVDPSVHTILIGHSMGGLVAADTLLTILDDDPVSGDAKFPFPHVAGVLAFDTPYLGLAPSMFAHGAEGNFKSASQAFSQFSSVASGMFASKAAAESAAAATAKPKGALPSAGEPKKDEPPAWQKWGKIAAMGGAAAALAGGAAAAYIKREDIATGFSWVNSHVEFVGALMKGEQLKTRLQRISNSDGVGFSILYTSLGNKPGQSLFYDGKERTFCTVPPETSPLKKKWFRAVNAMAKDEVGAHVAMFWPKTNPGYYEMANKARDLIAEWVPDDRWSQQGIDSAGMDTPYMGFTPKFENLESQKKKTTGGDVWEDSGFGAKPAPAEQNAFMDDNPWK